MKNLNPPEVKNRSNRRSFLKNGAITASTALGAGLLGDSRYAFGREEQSGSLTRGDAAILRFVAAAEILETDFWVQYNELGGIQDSEVPGGTGNPTYTAKLQVLDSDFPQYVHDNTDDEFTHQKYLHAYLISKARDP